MWEEIALFVAIGFAAQLVDGAIGMAYGLTGTSVMLTFGIPPATASASVHAAEVFTSGMSGLAHWRLGNVRWAILWRLALPGMVGGIIGALLLVSIPGDAIRPVVTAYLLVMGLWIVFRALGPRSTSSDPPRWVSLLGLGGGFIDAVGGGGWGPVVTTTMIGSGATPRYAIGSVNGAEFFVTLAISMTFLGTIGLELWPIITGLIIGGAIAAPAAAWVTRRMPDRPMMVLVGVVIIALSLFGLYDSLS